MTSLLERLGLPSLISAAAHATLLLVSWPLLVGAGRDDLLLAVWFGGGMLAGLVDGVVFLYGGSARSFRARLVLDAGSTGAAFARWVLMAAAIVVGDLVGWLLAGPSSELPRVDATGLLALAMAVVLGLLGAAVAALVMLLVVLPLGLLLASVLPRRPGERGSRLLGSGVVGLRAAALILLPMGWMLAAAVLAGLEVGGETGAVLWIASCVLAAGLIVLGVVLHNRHRS